MAPTGSSRLLEEHSSGLTLSPVSSALERHRRWREWVHDLQPGARGLRRGASQTLVHSGKEEIQVMVRWPLEAIRL